MGGLVVLILIAAIVVMFADDTTKLVKNLYKIYWLRVFAPMVFVSWFWVWNDELISFCLTWLQSHLLAVFAGPASLLPEHIQWVIFVLGLFVLASIPAYGYYWHAKKHAVLHERQKIIQIGRAHV